jgi:hypothetical protein
MKPKTTREALSNLLKYIEGRGIWTSEADQVLPRLFIEGKDAIQHDQLLAQAKAVIKASTNSPIRDLALEIAKLHTLINELDAQD